MSFKTLELSPCFTEDKKNRSQDRLKISYAIQAKFAAGEKENLHLYSSHDARCWEFKFRRVAKVQNKLVLIQLLL